MSFLKGFFSLFDWMFPKTLEEQFEDLDNSMQDLYDRMGWGEYKKPHPMSGWNYAVDINRLLEEEKQFNNALDNYIYWSKRTGATHKEYNPIVKDPARRRTSKYYDRQQFK